MLHRIGEFFDALLGLGLEANELGWSHMAWRSVIVFCFAVLLVRIGDRRFLGQMAGFDVMLVVILGSVLSRAINGSSAFFPSLGASALLVALHHFLGRLACHSHLISRLVKGRPRVLVREGRIDERELVRCNLTHDDLDENLRLNGNECGTDDVAEARLERNGMISVVKAKRRPATPFAAADRTPD